MKKFVRESWKAIIAFLGVFASIVYTRITSGESPLPALDDFPGWLGLIGGCFGTALIAYWKRNVLTPKQVAIGFGALPDDGQRQVVEAIGPGPVL